MSSTPSIDSPPPQGENKKCSTDGNANSKASVDKPSSPTKKSSMMGDFAKNFSKSASDLLVKFALFAKLELLALGLKGEVKVVFSGAVLGVKFYEGFTADTINDHRIESKEKLYSILNAIQAKEKEEKEEDSDSDTEKATSPEKKKDTKQFNFQKPKPLYNPNVASKLPPGKARAKENWKYARRLLLDFVRTIRLKAVRLAYEDYEAKTDKKTFEKALASIPTNSADFEAMLSRQIPKLLNSCKKSFRAVLESIVKRAGTLFTKNYGDIFGDLFATLSQKLSTDLSPVSYLSAGIDIEVTLQAANLIDRYFIIKSRDRILKKYQAFADSIVQEHVQILHLINLDLIKKRNEGSIIFGWVKKEDRKRNHLLRKIKPWKIRYLVLSSRPLENTNVEVTTNIRKSIIQVLNYAYELTYFEKASDRSHLSTPILLTKKMHCFSHPKVPGAFRLCIDKQGRGWKDGMTEPDEHWETVLSSMPILYDDPDTKEIGVTFESAELALEIWVNKINEVIDTLVQE